MLFRSVAFTRASMEFLAGFHNGHTVFINQTLVQQGGSLPFVAQLLKGQWVVKESWSAGIKSGDVIESIDGRSFAEFVQDSSKLIAASTEAGGRRMLFARMPSFTPYAHLFPEQFVLPLAGGRKVAVDRSALQPAEPLATSGRWLEPGKVAYIRIPSFMSPDFEKRAIELAKEFRHADVLIVDVRGNPGGSTPGGLTAFLMDRSYRWWAEAAPVAIPFFRIKAAQGHEDYQLFKSSDIMWPSTSSNPPQDNFTGKLALLIDAGCMSACEDFTMPFKDNHRATIVGETTAGSTGQPFMLDLGRGMMIMVGAKREMFPDGSRFEGVGIKPDVEVVPVLEDLSQRRDTVLEAARKQMTR